MQELKEHHKQIIRGAVYGLKAKLHRMRQEKKDPSVKTCRSNSGGATTPAPRKE